MEEEEEAEETQETEAKEDGELGDDEEDEDDDGDSEVSQDLVTHFHQVVDTQSGLDAQWLLILWSYQNEEIQACYRMEGLEYWTRINEKANQKEGKVNPSTR